MPNPPNYNGFCNTALTSDKSFLFTNKTQQIIPLNPPKKGCAYDWE